ncbi:MAG: hypothetical protein AAB518_00375 [Patescibacteria group bacterium]
MNEKYLRPKQEYIDRYDRYTVEKCRWWLSHSIDTKSLAKDPNEKKLSEKEEKQALAYINHLHNYFYTGERYIKKEETIREWMREDEARDKFFEAAKAPENITCLTCGRLTFVSSKHLNMGWDKKPDTILFFYDCPLGHIPHRAFYENGEEFRHDPPRCPKCKTPVNEEDTVTDAAFITNVTCPKCDYTDTSEIKRTVHEESKPDPDYAKDRARFCLSEKEGQEFIQQKYNLEQVSKMMDELKEKDKNKELYDKVAKLKKLKIIELEQLLAPVLEKEGYIKLQFKTPEITKDVVVPFVVYEQRPDREDRASTYELEKLLRKTLKETNWRLMTDGVSYRLGMLEGRLHGYEREEDFVKLVKDK